MTSDSKDTLREFAKSRSEEAFRKLVREHSPLVYGTALRKLGGNRAAAQDVTQEVFTLLARKAHGLGPVVLGGWLYRQACRQAANHVRSESRRKLRESIAMELQPDNSPSRSDALSGELDTALLSLPETDRNALILRFFEGKEFKVLGSELGLSEEAARKRVARALERIGGNLRRKGLVTSGALLGATMTGYGRTEVPSQCISRWTEHSLQAGTAITAGSVLSVMLPLAAGVIVTSLVAIASSPPPAAGANPASTTTAGPEPRSTRATASPSEPSLEDMVNILKRNLSKPAHSLTALQSAVIMDGIGFPQIPEFIRLANDRMTPGERASVYPVLLKKWLAADPEAAMDFALSEDVGSQVDPFAGSNLLGNLFSDWLRRDSASCEEWLLENREHRVLRETAFSGTLRDFLMIQLVDVRFTNSGVASAFELIHRIPSPEDQAAAMRGMAGDNRWFGTWRRGDRGKWLEFHHELMKLPDADLRDELMRSFWTTLGGERADDVGAMYADMEPVDRYQVALGLLGVRKLPSSETRLLFGVTVAHSPVTDEEQREAAVLEAGLAAGVERNEVMTEIGKVILTTRTDSDFFKWFDSQAEPPMLDDALMEMVRKSRYSDGWTHGEEMAAVELARRISDDGVRRKLCRAHFRRCLGRTPEPAVAYANRSDLPPDLKAELQGILHETP